VKHEGQLELKVEVNATIQNWEKEVLLPFLVAFSTQGKSSVIDPIKKHPLYSRDILRAVMKLAIMTKRKMKSLYSH
jgi:hypothetical protein